jgi:hypothetical protein
VGKVAAKYFESDFAQKLLNTRARILCNRNEKIINQKFVLLKVASDKKFGQHF